MQENKVTFPGNRVSAVFFSISAGALAMIFLVAIVSLFEGWSIHEVASEFWGLRSVIITLVTVATLSFQHKAVFMRKANENKIHFWKQFTPLFVYRKRDFDVEELSTNTRKSTSTNDNGNRTTSYATYVYDGGKQIFVFDGTNDDLCDLVPELNSDSNEKLLESNPESNNSEEWWK